MHFICVNSPEQGHSEKGKFCVNKTAVIGFLKRNGDLNGMLCPTCRGSTDEKSVVVLPSDTTKSDVFNDYEDAWKDSIAAAHEICNDPYPKTEKSVYYSRFAFI